MIKIYNTLTKNKEKLQTRDPEQISIYVCGPTVYNYIHLGNARPLVVFDTVRRYLTSKGYKTNYIQNFTDVDDKIINKAREEKKEPLALAAFYIIEYFKDVDALNIIRADHYPRVSEHIPEIIALIQKLVHKGSAYDVKGSVYFRVRNFANYGKLSGRTLDDLQVGARVEINEDKQDPLDFALWKKAQTGELSWDSPWGAGRPGWHIECSAMALKYLGTGFDIHAGGCDLMFPHHENEIAQAETASEQQFAKYWMHNGFITVNQEKMSKSLDNFFLVRDILKQFSAATVRFYLLSVHYRSPLDFDAQKLAAIQRGLERLINSWQLLEETLKTLSNQKQTLVNNADAEINRQFDIKLQYFEKTFNTAMADDFNTALAIAVWFDAARELNAYLHQINVANLKATINFTPTFKILKKAQQLFLNFNQVLGIFKTDDASRIVISKSEIQDDHLVNNLMTLIIAIRQQARENKDWHTADMIRDSLKKLAIMIEDTPQGARWKKR